jgi:hypothetical protein
MGAAALRASANQPGKASQITTAIKITNKSSRRITQPFFDLGFFVGLGFSTGFCGGFS